MNGNGQVTVLPPQQKQAVRDLRVRRMVRGDSWYNQKSRFGGSGDPVIQTNFLRSRNRIKREDAEALYELSWLAARAVDQIGNDATREWITLTHDTDPEKANKLREEDRRLNGRGLFEEGIRWGRLHGGCLLVLGAYDGQDPENELQVERVRQFMFASNVDRWLAYPRQWYRDPDSDKYGQPEVYQIHRLSPIGTAGSLPVPSAVGFPDGGGGGGLQGQGVKLGGPVAWVHETRTIRFDGDPLPPVALVRNWGWRASILDKIYDELRHWGVTAQAASSIVPTFITKKMKIGNLIELIQNDEWETIRARIGEVHAAQALHNLVFYGNDEELDHMGTPIQGLDSLMDKFMDQVSGAVGIPKSILFQAESGALGGTAAGTDVRNWYARVGAFQENILRPRIRKWLDVIGVPLGLKPGEVDFEFKPLWQLTEKEQAEVYYMNAQGDQIAINTGMVDAPERLGVFRFGGTEYNAASPVIDVDRMEKTLEEIDKQPVELGMGDAHGIPNAEQFQFEQEKEHGIGPFDQSGGAAQQRNESIEADRHALLDLIMESVTKTGGVPRALLDAYDRLDALEAANPPEEGAICPPRGGETGELGQEREDIARARVKAPGSRGGHIIGYTSKGDPIYGTHPAATEGDTVELLELHMDPAQVAHAKMRLEQAERLPNTDTRIQRRTEATHDRDKLVAWYHVLKVHGWPDHASKVLAKLHGMGLTAYAASHHERVTATARLAPEAFHEETLRAMARGISKDTPVDKSVAERTADLHAHAEAAKKVATDPSPPVDPGKGHMHPALTPTYIETDTVRWHKLGDATGSNPGGLYMGKDHKVRYLKEYSDSAQAHSEDLANRVYKALGIAAPESSVTHGREGDPTHYASLFMGGSKQVTLSGMTKDDAVQVLKGFAADVLLGNWDVVGANGDNLLKREQGHIVRADNGGSLLFRAKAGRKSGTALYDAESDYKGFASAGTNPSYARVFEAAGVDHPDDLGQDLVHQIDSIKDLRDRTNNFRDFMPTADPRGLTPDDKDSMIRAMQERAHYLIETVKPRVQEKLKAPPVVTSHHIPDPPKLRAGSSKAKIWEALKAAGPTGAKMKDVGESLGMPITTYYEAASALVKSGHLVKEGKVYRVVDHTEAPPGTDVPRSTSTGRMALPKWINLDKSTGPSRADAMARASNPKATHEATVKFVRRSSALMRVHPKGLRGILADGRFKNQYESGSSSGYFGEEGRKRAELEMLGIPSTPPPPNEHRPIYGYIHPFGSMNDEGHSVPMYGEIRIKLKDHVKDRATITVGDSLMSGVRPSPFHDPGLECHTRTYRRDGWAMMKDTVHATSGVSYVEAQYHGGLTVDDIEHITFQSPSAASGFTSTLKKLGIPYNTDGRAP